MEQRKQATHRHAPAAKETEMGVCGLKRPSERARRVEEEFGALARCAKHVDVYFDEPECPCCRIMREHFKPFVSQEQAIAEWLKLTEHMDDSR